MKGEANKEPPEELSWERVRAFLALHRTGSYQAAAVMVGVDDSTLRRRIQALEADVGVSLFVRTNGRWSVAPAQERMLEAAVRMESAARQFALAHRAHAGLVRISMLEMIANWLVPAFREFEARHPEIVLNITTETHFVDLERDGVDMAIRIARPLHGMNNLRIRKLGPLEFAPYATRAYLHKHALADAPGKQPGRHRIIGNSIEFAHQDHAFAFGSIDWLGLGIEGDVAVWSDSISTMTRLCENDAGVALLPTLLARDHAGLVRVQGCTEVVNAEIWLVSSLDLRSDWQRDLIQLMSARLQAVGLV